MVFAKASCEVYVNTNNQTIVRQDCSPEGVSNPIQYGSPNMALVSYMGSWVCTSSPKREYGEKFP
ncbi:Late embryogenesis abundant hydroxyproline-rich glycoprotein family [Prunus dulcis]|uniref:Late embryogenesis abundant hydroxyproline-rich glycoprotein family n=1 Tax=Prunus dulcis TaxID=3755 RepID=A0A4Y1RVQ5_PRUDU|nr:Late embryogenesis abundant hydroxyproline-rich glycoprotein family [Prunus dulcis]